MIGWDVRRYAEYIERITGQREVVPGGLLLEPPDPPDYAAHKGQLYCASAPNSPAVAGQFSFVHVSMPIASKKVAIWELAENLQSTQQVVVRVDGIARAGGVPVFTLDTRFYSLPGGAAGVLQVGSAMLVLLGSAAAQDGNSVMLLSSASTTFGMPPIARTITNRLTIWPGHNVIFWGAVVNTAAIVNLRWRERPTEPEELVL